MPPDTLVLIQTLDLKDASEVASLFGWGASKLFDFRNYSNADIALVRLTVQSASLLRYQYGLSPQEALHHLNNALIKSEFDDDPDYEFHSLITGLKLAANCHLNRSVNDLTKEAVESEKAEQVKRFRVVIPTEIAPEAQLEKLMDELEAALGAIAVTPNVETAFRNLEQVVKKLYL